MTDLSFSCSCGAVSGRLEDVSPKTGDRYVCYCTDCRDFARYCGHEAEALDAAGGLSVYQTRVGRLRIERGLDHLACVNLAGKQTLRWFCRECRTPLFNTMDSGKWPFLSMITQACDPASRDAVLGPPKGSVFVERATGEDVVTPPVSTFTMIRRVIRRLVPDKVSGAGKRYPLFDPASGDPISVPLRLTEAEKTQLGRS